MTEMPCLKDSFTKLIRSFGLNLLGISVIFAVLFCVNFLDQQQLWASPKVKVLYKPKLDQAVYFYSQVDQAIQIKARVVGEYGERLSNVSVRLEHPCFKATTIQSDFDAIITSKLAIKQTLSDQCNPSIFAFLEQQSPEIQVRLPQLTEFKPSAADLNNGLKEHFLVKQLKKLVWLRPTVNLSQNVHSAIQRDLELYFTIFVHQSIINSSSEFQHAFKAMPFKLEVQVHPSSYLYQNDHIVLVNKLSLHHNFPKTLSVPFEQALNVQQRVKRVEIDSKDSVKHKVLRTQQSLLKIGDELEFKTSVEALRTYRFLYEFNWLKLAPIKVQSYPLKLLPKFKLKDLELSQSFWRSQCSINGSIQALGINPQTPLLNRYLQDLVTQKQIQLKAKWSTFNTEALDRSDKAHKPINTDEADIPIVKTESWSQDFMLPKEQAVQIYIQLFTKADSTPTWQQQGESYKSPLLVNYSHMFDLVILLFVYIVALGLAYGLWRVFAQQKTASVSGPVKSIQGLTVTRLSELNDSFSETATQTNYLICDALSHELISGELILVSLDIFGAPQRWTKSFHRRLAQSKHRFKNTFESVNSSPIGSNEDSSTELVAGQVFWVCAEHYEPLLFEVPKGFGTVVIPLWPCRFALTRIWNELFLKLKIKQSFGKGSFIKLQQEIQRQGNLELIETFNLFAQDLYDKKELTHQQLLDALATLDKVLEQLHIPRSLLYPPSDYQRIIKL